jgi:hypothetical protein
MFGLTDLYINPSVLFCYPVYTLVWHPAYVSSEGFFARAFERGTQLRGVFERGLAGSP